MSRLNLNTLIAFRAVARERSFTRAAAQLGVSPSALSHTIRGLEGRLGIRLLTRTTRSVVPTDAGERLLKAVGPHFDGIEAELETLSDLSDSPAGSIRISTGIHAGESILRPALKRLLPLYPEIEVELSVNAGFIDIVAERFDAGVRLGETIARTWWRSGSGRTCGWPRSLRPTIFPPASRRERRTSLPSTIASTCAFPPSADSTPESSRRAAAR
jgi:DNA-binding transcriptional LysR family regulator